MQDDYKNISARIKNGEGLQLDFKHSISDTKKIARSLVAFANTEGGSLLIGVRDNGSIAGVRSEEEYYMIETAALIYCRPPVEFLHQNHIVSGKNILEIIVNKSVNMPHSAPDNDGIFKSYVRVADQNLVAPKTLVEVWKRNKKNYAGVKLVIDHVVETLFNEITENGSISKSQLMRITGIRSAEADKLLINLMLMEILDIEMTEKSTRYIFHPDYESGE